MTTYCTPKKSAPALVSDEAVEMVDFSGWGSMAPGGGSAMTGATPTTASPAGGATRMGTGWNSFATGGASPSAPAAGGVGGASAGGFNWGTFANSSGG